MLTKLYMVLLSKIPGDNAKVPKLLSPSIILSNVARTPLLTKSNII